MARFGGATSVLVVGAGPAGLTLAVELLRRGVDCRIVERLPEPVGTSRAFTLHARTLELYDAAGIVEPFLQRGRPVPAMDYRFRGEDSPIRLSFAALDSAFPYILVMNQDTTERTLREEVARLGGHIEWARSCTALEELGGGVDVSLVDGSGRETGMRADWVVGCDGIGSTVRRAVGLGYEGTEYSGMQMRMMDVPVEGFPLGADAIHYLIDEDVMLLVVELPSGRYRVLVSDMGPERPDQARVDDFQAIVDHFFAGSVRLGVPHWATVFQIWRRLASCYRAGRVFLAGDAAHVHSPAGGQGMNVCIQDACNLGWRLADVVKGTADDDVLDLYEQERRPVAQQVLEGTHALHAVIMAHGIPLEDRRRLAMEPLFHERAVRLMAGVSFTYGDGATGALGVGDRAPDVDLSDGRRLYEALRPGGHVTVEVSEPGVAPSSPVGVHATADGQPGGYGPGTWLVRPDGYVGGYTPAGAEAR